jgi:hypothetical protein
MTSKDDIKGFVSFKFLCPCIVLCVQCSSETVVSVEFHPLDAGALITCGKGRVVFQHKHVLNNV